MAGPFPGMDPYIEALGAWQDFHNRALTYINDVFGETLPASYVALTDERIRLVEASNLPGPEYRPDVLVARGDREVQVSQPSGGAALATIEPVEVSMTVREPEEVRETWIEIRRLPELSLVTVLELLSPSNKEGVGRADYLEKRADLLGDGIHLVEIDLLLSGRRLPMGGELPDHDYYAIVARAERFPRADVYPWSIRRPLPTIPVPLRTPDADVWLDLGAIVATAYDRARYGVLLRYDEPLTLPLAPEDREWAEGIARGAAHR